MSSPHQNTRSAQRFDRRLPIDYVIGGSERRSGHTKNISLGGVFIESDQQPAFGTRVAIALRVPTQKEPIEVGGIVRWVDAGGFGIQFDGLRARDVWALGKYFEQPA